MIIEGSENIRDIFCIFHDGVVARASSEDGNLVFEVEIRYLAERINPSYTKFFVRLASVRDIYFTT